MIHENPFLIGAVLLLLIFVIAPLMLLAWRQFRHWLRRNQERRSQRKRCERFIDKCKRYRREIG